VISDKDDARAASALRSQIVISKKGRGGRRYLPYAFTEQGVAMLSSVLRSARAVEVNIAIMRTFVQLRRLTDHESPITSSRLPVPCLRLSTINLAFTKPHDSC
jgi:ORF6N domain